MNKNKVLSKIYIFSLFYFLFIDYKYFTIFALIILIFNFISKNEKSIPNYEKKILLISPFIFYIQKIIIGLFYESTMWERTFFDVKYSFVDAKITISQLICQSNQEFLLGDKFQSMSDECLFGGARYGPLFHILKIDLGDDSSVIFITALLYLFFLFFFIRIK